jgi:hypothetical protein
MSRPRLGLGGTWKLQYLPRLSSEFSGVYELGTSVRQVATASAGRVFVPDARGRAGFQYQFTA